MDDLRTRLVELQATVEKLVSVSEPPVLRSGDPEIDSAARTLRFAQQTADAVVAEARNDAAGIVADAERQRGEIIRRARQQADEDYSTERTNVQRASAAWQAQRIELVAQLDMLVALSAKYRDGLDHLDAGINALSERLKQGTLADMVVVDSLPAPADVVLDPAPEAAAAAAEPAAAEPAAVVETVDLREQGAASAEAVLSGEVDPFVFDAADLPDSTGNFAWEAEEPPTGGPATTF